MALEVQQINMGLYSLSEELINDCNKEEAMWQDAVMMDLGMYLKHQEELSYLINLTEDEMVSYKKDAQIRAKTLVHPEYVDSFLETLSYGYWDEVEGALRIAKQLGLTNKHFLAIDDNLPDMQALLKSEVHEDDDYFD